MPTNTLFPREVFAPDIVVPISDLITSRKRCDQRNAHTYRLKFAPHDGECRKDIEFEAMDAYRAILLIQKAAKNSPVELWRDGCKLCSISLREDGLWELQPRQY